MQYIYQKRRIFQVCLLFYFSFIGAAHSTAELSLSLPVLSDDNLDDKMTTGPVTAQAQTGSILVGSAAQEAGKARQRQDELKKRLPEQAFTSEAQNPEDSNHTYSDSVCAIPPNTEIVHFPIRIWTPNADYIKKAQETIDTIIGGAKTAYQFVQEHLGNTDQSEPTVEDKNKQAAIVEEVARSHFALAQLIQKNPNSFVFHEFETQIRDTRDIHSMIESVSIWKEVSIQTPEQLPDMKNRKPEHLFQLVNAQFPDGFSKKYADLNENQKYTLAVAGGVHTLFFLNKLPIIFPSIFPRGIIKKYLRTFPVMPI